MIPSGFVVSSENSLGPGHVVDRLDGHRVLVEYFESPANSEQPRAIVPLSSLSAYRLHEQTRVYHQDPDTFRWNVGRVVGVPDERVCVRFPNDERRMLLPAELRIRWNKPMVDPTEHLAYRLNETAYWHSGRAEFVKSLVCQRAVSAGMRGLLSSGIDLELHQLAVIRRVRRDPNQRYLLADEVGLGKTVEAGVLIREYVLEDPGGHRVIVIVPESLVEQWREELTAKFFLDSYLDKSVFVVSHTDLEGIARYGTEARMVVVDEAHHLCSWITSLDETESRVFELVQRIVTDRTRRLFLLSATPVLHNEQGFLTMLQLLDPVVYRAGELAAFRNRVARRQELAEVLFSLTDKESNFFLADAAERLATAFGGDHRLSQLVAKLQESIQADVPETDPERTRAIHPCELDQAFFEGL